MMEFILLINSDEKTWTTMTEAESGRVHAAYMAYTQALHDAGVFVAGSQLAPSTTATTVRVATDGKTSVLDGPYAETKEQLGGYYLIDVPDLDAAISWAARCPGAAYGSIEVRPLVAVPAVA
jgi:hypothetical protein